MITLFTLFSASSACIKNATFFGLKPWYAYLETNSDCSIKNFNVLTPDGKSDIALILLVVVDDLLRIAGLVAVGYVIYGGITYVMSQGSPDQTQKAQHTVQNAVIGLIVALVAIALVSWIGSAVGK